MRLTRTRRGGRPAALAALLVGGLILGAACSSTPTASPQPSNRQTTSSAPAEVTPSTSASVPTGPCTVPEPTDRAQTAASAPVVPSHGVYVGAFSLQGAATQSNLVESLNSFADAACRSLDIAHLYLRWRYPFPTTSATTFADQGKAVLVSWTGTDAVAMASGADDSEIEETAREIASLHAPVFLEYRWEMDRPNLGSIVHSPADYIAAWDHIRQVFASVGTPNVSWVWCPTAGGFARGTAQAYYPGDDEVDWVCTDAYPVDVTGSATHESFGRLLRPFLDWTRSHDKPVMIGEFGVPRAYSAADRATFFDQVRTLVTESRRIKALVYFDDDPPGASLTQTYSLGNDPTVIESFRRLVNDDYLKIQQ